MIRFVCFASGSSGNCYYLATDKTSILIDAGIGARTIKRRFKEFGLDLESLKAVLVTHDHVDHVKAVGVLGEKYHIPIYSTSRVHDGIKRCYNVTEKLKVSARFIKKEVSFTIGDFSITPFEVPHDSLDNIGYYIEAEGQKFCLATDIGHMTEVIAGYLSKANYLVVESNYDEAMLLTGHYPQHLKERILGPNGHLSNRETAEFLASYYSPNWRQVWLCHLSKDNNNPEIAYHTVETSLERIGVKVGKDLPVTPLKRIVPSGVYILNENRQLSLFSDMDMNL